MALRWFATSPIYFNNVRAFNAGNLVPASIVQAHDLDSDGLVVQINVDVDDPAVVLRPILTSDFDTDTEREKFVPSRLSEVALREAFGLVVKVTDYGGKDDGGVTDNPVALNNALAAVQAAGGGTVHIPAGRHWYFLTAVNTITAPLTITGAGGGPADTAATRLVFAAGLPGLHIDAPGTVLGVRDLAVLSLSTAAGAGQHGLHVTDGRASLSDVALERFGGHGVFFDSTSGGNVNHSLGVNVRAYGNRGDGIRIEGGDANAITLVAPDVVANYGWGINNVGNHNLFIAPHADQQYNGSPGAFRDDAYSSQWQHVYAENGGEFLIDLNSRSGVYTDTTFGAPVMEFNGVGYTTWDITRAGGAISQILVQGIEPGQHQYRFAGVTGFGRLDLQDMTGGRTILTVMEDGSAVYWYQPIAPTADATTDLGLASNRWRDVHAIGLVLSSPDGTRYRVTVANDGTLSSAPA